MTRDAQKHLANARGYIAKGEEFYRKAAKEIRAAQKTDPTLGYREIGEYFKRSAAWVTQIVSWDTTVQGTKRLPFSEPAGAVAVRHTRSTLKSAKPSDVAEDLLSDPQIRKTLQRAEDIRANKMVREAQRAERQALGDEASDALVHQQTLRNAEAELFKARRAIIQTLRLLDVAKLEVDDSWREEFLRTFDDIIEKAELGRDLLVGDLHEELTELLAGEAS
jgi:hypothetical protein